MKKLFLSLISLALAGSAYAQLNTFSEGDIVSAEKMNENFEVLLKKSMVVRSTTVDCDAGETINAALTDGYNDITVTGTCNEEIVAMSLFDATAVDRQRFPSEPVGHIIITGGEDNRGAVLASQVYSAFQGSLQLVNLTVTDRISVFANSFLFMSDVTHNAALGAEGTLRVDENSFVFIQESDLSEEITLRKGSTGLIKNVDLDISSEGPFIFVEKNSVLELNDVKITHQSVNFSPQRNDLTSADSLVTAIGNSSVSIADSTIQTTTSVAFLIMRGSELELSDSTVTSDSLLSIFTINAKLDIKNSTISNTINEAVGMIEGSSGYISEATITGTGDQAILVSGSDLKIENRSSIGLSGNTQNGKETILITGGAFVEISESTIENTSTGSGIDIEKSSSLMVEKTTIHSTNDWAIFVSQGSNLFADSDGDSLDIDRISDTTNIDIFALKKSSLFFGNNNYTGVINIDCSSFVDIRDSSNVTGCSD